MSDTKVEGRPILKPTLCRVGTHVWTWTGSLSTALGTYNLPQGANERCDCGTYLWSERNLLNE